MKRIAILLIGITLMFMSCKKDLDKPSIPSFPSGNEWSVGRLLDSLEHSSGIFQLTDESYKNAIVKGYVIADETGGNIYRTIYLRGEDGKCIAFYRPKGDEYTVRVGDHIGFKLYGSYLGYYSGLPQVQIQDNEYNSLFVIYESHCTDRVQPISTTISEIKTGKYLCNLIKLSDVQFTPYKDRNYVDYDNMHGGATDRTLVSCEGEGIIVRTSQYALFADDPLPAGKGTIVSIATYYQNQDVWQLLVRTAQDVKLNGPRCESGDGTYENPYTATDVINLNINDANEHYWVKDYIVGFVDAGYNYVFSTDGAVNTNLIISSNVEASQESECSPVQLPAGAIRNGLNLVNHPENYKVEVLLYGTLETYFQRPGVKNVSYAEINGNSYGVNPNVVPPSVVDLPYNETFLSSQGSFQIVDVNLGNGLNYVWKHNSQYECMKGSGYYNSAHEAESWLISPTINLTSVNSAKMSFMTACNYETNPQEEMTLWVSTNYTDDIAAADWTQIVLTNYGSGFNFVNTGEIDLSEYVGNNIHVGFKYKSTNSNAATWEIKNFIVEE